MTSIPRWKYWVSYLSDLLIEQRSTEINPELYLLLSKGRLQLCTDKAIYSYEDRYDNFRILFDKHWTPDQLTDREVLVLGLGLGSIPILLEKLYPHEPWYFTAVEIDEEIIELAELYTMSYIVSPVDVITGDGEMFVQFTEQKFDLICVDIFLNEIIPSDILQTDFLENCKERLNAGGQLIFNTLAYTETDKNRSQQFFQQVFSKVFPEAKAIHCHRNLMLLSQ